MVLNENLKAIVAGLVAGLAALQTALLSPGVTANEWIIVALAVLAGAGLVGATPDAETMAVMKQLRSERKASLVRKVTNKE